MVGLGYLAGGDWSTASEISADGSTIAGQGSSDSGGQAFRWTEAAGLVGLGSLPGGKWSYVSGISADGAAIVGDCFTGEPFSVGEAFRWTEATGMVGLGFLPGGRWSFAYGVSADGAVVVGEAESDVGPQAFLWTEATGTVGLGVLHDGNTSFASALSSDGSMILGRSDPAPPDYYGQAFIWDPANGNREIDQVLTGFGVDSAGWNLETAAGISADGQAIAGWDSRPGAPSQGWIAVVPSCGNGLIQLGETCDDKNTTSGDGCSESCSSEVPLTACSDGIDNDGDTFIDFPEDFGCRDASSDLENPECDDDIDNDGVEGIDWDGGPLGGVPDGQCLEDPSSDNECGYGVELAFILPAVGLAAGRRRRV